MKVVATRMGIWKNERKRPGAIFDVPDGMKISWAKPYDPQAPKEAEAALSEPDTFSSMTGKHGQRNSTAKLTPI